MHTKNESPSWKLKLAEVNNNMNYLYIALGNGYGPLPVKTIEEALASGFRDDRVYAVEVFDKSTGKCVANVRRADYSKGN